MFQPVKNPASVEAELLPDRSYYDSRYVFSLISPRSSKELTFEDEFLNIRFSPKDRLFFILANRSRQAIQIDWEKVAYIDLSGKKHRVIHQGVALAEKDSKQSPGVVGAGASLDSSLYPADMVAGSRIFNDWRLNPMLPLTQQAAYYKWRTLAVVMPVEIGKQTRYYQFVLRIDDVVV